MTPIYVDADYIQVNIPLQGAGGMHLHFHNTWNLFHVYHNKDTALYSINTSDSDGTVVLSTSKDKTTQQKYLG